MILVDKWCSEKEIYELINKSEPQKQQLKCLNFEETHGWVYITLMVNNREVKIKYSSVMTAITHVIRFFSELTTSKEDIAMFLDNEGSDPLLYANPINEKEIRFLFAHDYNLYSDDNIDDYKIADYTIEFDIILDKKTLLQEFYNILKSYIDGIDETDEEKVEEINLERAEFQLEIIEKYLNNSN